MFCSQSVCLCLCVYCKDEWMNELASIYYLIYITCYISPPPHPYSEPHNQLLLNWTSNCSCSVSILSINSSLLVMTTIIVVVVIMIIMLVTSSTLYCNHYSFLSLSLMLSLSIPLVFHVIRCVEISEYVLFQFLISSLFINTFLFTQSFSCIYWLFLTSMYFGAYVKYYSTH